MTVRVNKDSFNIREKLSELERPIGLKGSELMSSATAQEARDFVSAGRKNMIINGAMNIFQRNNGGLITTNYSLTKYQVDRFGGQIQSANVFTAERADNDAPPGFRYSLKYTTTNAVTPNSNHYFWVGQTIEGYNLQQCGWNTSNPKHITISFWVKSSVIGTWALAVRAFTSSLTAYLATYDINVANTWEYKTITVPPPFILTGLQYTNSKALGLQFDLGTSRSGDLYASARNKWVNENSYADANTVKIHGIAGATWQITGVQLEVGKNATEFEHRSYGEELALCQRYFYKFRLANQEMIYNESSAANQKWHQFYIGHPMRANPAVDVTDLTTGGSIGGLTGVINGLTPQTPGDTPGRISSRVTMSASGGTARNVYHYDGWNGDYVSLSAEL